MWRIAVMVLYKNFECLPDVPGFMGRNLNSAGIRGFNSRFYGFKYLKRRYVLEI
jgi:hypothetical protein